MYIKNKFLNKEKIKIGGKNKVVYTGLKGGKFYMKNGKKRYLKGGTTTIPLHNVNNEKIGEIKVKVSNIIIIIRKSTII